MKKFYPLILVSFILITSSIQGFSQSDFRVQSVFIYNFTRLIAWPADYQTGDFVVAVYGTSPISSEIQTMADTKKAGNQSIVGKTFITTSDITKCHILYVPSTQTRKLEEIVETLVAKGIKALIVTDSRNAIKSGAVVNFTVVDSRQRFELSQSNASIMGLTLGNEIARLAILAD